MHIQFNSVTTLLIACVMLLIGRTLRINVKFFERFLIPTPVIGGFIASITVLILKKVFGIDLLFDVQLQSPLMVAFFTTVGLGGSYTLIKTGGKALVVYLLLCWFVALYQSGLGILLASMFDIHPVLGVMSGAVALEGGHGNAAAFGSMAEDLGVSSSTAVAIAAATFGLIAGSLLGGPVGGYLIRKHNLKIEAENITFETKHDKHTEVSAYTFIRTLALLLVSMVIGQYIAGIFTMHTGYSLPAYVGAMLVAIVLRNFNDIVHVVTLNEKAVNLIAEISLGLFLTMAMMNMRLWELADVAGPLIIMLVIQVLCLVGLTVFVLFRMLGKSYDSAIMCAGMIGHGLGATPNAVANMPSVTERYGVHSPKAFLIIPLCGAVLIDVVSIPWHTWLINYLVK
ncbi:sodium/glutamate symporter [Taylorella equigenitalis]|uniref:sodium/glutamate symporter n=1 Tax=Taylorella equigenitalis TaxID=29575 RepID=UPI0023B1482B|nr:sodium/glutamate symporter [Taylorella equigenitalis]WEE00333.1 sodium/glutamate symporter [Taylorella equigenitalis]